MQGMQACPCMADCPVTRSGAGGRRPTSAGIIQETMEGQNRNRSQGDTQERREEAVDLPRASRLTLPAAGIVLRTVA
jgi:hypothetical protein